MSGSQSAVGLPDWSLSPFIRLFYQRSQQPWQLQRWSSLACFHDIVGKPWHLISLREMGFERWGTRVAKPSSPRYMIYCTSAAGCEKCFYPWTSCLRSSFSVSLSFMLTKLLFFPLVTFFGDSFDLQRFLLLQMTSVAWKFMPSALLLQVQLLSTGS